jgi:anti-sigma factor (TIGR02949 family)
VIDCTTAVRQLWDFVEHTVSEESAAEIEEHLAFCRRCCGEVEFAEELRDLLKTSSGPRIPADAEARLSEFIDEIQEAEDD